MQQKSILFVTTADTDILTADRAVSLLPPMDFPAWSPSTRRRFAESRERRTDIVSLARKCGSGGCCGSWAASGPCPSSFDPLVRHCRSEGVPLIACPGHQEWDEDLVAACTTPVAEVDTVFSYLMQGGVQNFQNLLLFLSDAYFGTDHGHEAPAPLPWEGIYHP